MRKLLSLSMALPATTVALAHEGHGHTHGFTITHYFTEYEHAIPLLLAVVAVILLVKRYRKTATKK